jgi:hypothetical protein
MTEIEITIRLLSNGIGNEAVGNYMVEQDKVIVNPKYFFPDETDFGVIHELRTLRFSKVFSHEFTHKEIYAEYESGNLKFNPAQNNVACEYIVRKFNGDTINEFTLLAYARQDTFAQVKPTLIMLHKRALLWRTAFITHAFVWMIYFLILIWRS